MEEPVSGEDINFLIDCAIYAPSGTNMQPWSFLVIQNKEVMQKLSESGKKILGNKKSVTADRDCAMAAQNMMLAAHSRGIGSCWIGLVMPALRDEQILEEPGAPPVYKAVAPLIFGFPQGKTAMPERREPEVKWLR